MVKKIKSSSRDRKRVGTRQKKIAEFFFFSKSNRIDSGIREKAIPRPECKSKQFYFRRRVSRRLHSTSIQFAAHRWSCDLRSGCHSTEATFLLSSTHQTFKDIPMFAFFRTFKSKVLRFQLAKLYLTRNYSMFELAQEKLSSCHLHSKLDPCTHIKLEFQFQNGL